MALHPRFPKSPYTTLTPEFRWFPADEALREAADSELGRKTVVFVMADDTGNHAKFRGYHSLDVDQKILRKHKPTTFADLAAGFIASKP